MTDRYNGSSANLTTPAVRAQVLTPSDSTNITGFTRGLMVSTAVDVRVTLTEMADGTHVTLPSLAAGVIHPLRVKRLWATGTGAATIIGLD